MEKNNWVDLERAAKISGARWYFLKGELALLENALVKYAIDFMMKKKYEFEENKQRVINLVIST